MRSTIGDWIVGHSRLTFAAAIGLILIAGLLAGAIALNASNAQLQVEEAFTVRAAARDLLDIAQDAETGQRGFLLTHERSYLQPFEQAQDAAVATIARLRALVADYPAMHQRVDRADQMLTAKLEELRQTIALADAGNMNEAIAIVR